MHVNPNIWYFDIYIYQPFSFQYFNFSTFPGLFWLMVTVAGFAQYQKPPDFMCPEFGKNHYFRYVYVQCTMMADTNVWSNCRRVPL